MYFKYLNQLFFVWRYSCKSYDLGAATVNKIVVVYCNNMQFWGVPFQSKWWGGVSNAAGTLGPGEQGNKGGQGARDISIHITLPSSLNGILL